MLPILAQQYELELLSQGPSGQSHFPICLGKGTGNRAKGQKGWKECIHMTSYSTLMVIMALSASVSKLQPSEICVTSILTSPGHSRSKLMAPFERASMTSYSTLMVTMALSASVSKLQPSEICVTWILISPGHSRSKPMVPYERASMTSYSTLMQHEHIQTILESQTYSIACLNKNYLDTYTIIFFILIFNL